MKLAFVVDPLERLKAYKDSSIAMMREAARRGHEVHALEAGEMFSREGKIRARTRRLDVLADDHAWYRAHDPREVVLADFDVVMMRKDPPFDQEYYYATLLLDGVVARLAALAAAIEVQELVAAANVPEVRAANE